MGSTEQAKKILSQKTTGPNGILAYTVGNAVNDQGIPYLDSGSDVAPEIYYAVTETNRVGIPVVNPPAGTQDVYASKDGEQILIQLGKAKYLNAALEKIGEPASSLEGQALEEHVLSVFLDRGYEVTIESPYSAAVHETAEEHGVVISKLETVGDPELFTMAVAAKRSLQAAEKSAEKKLFTMDGINGSQDFAALVEGDSMQAVQKATQNIYAVQVRSFEDTTPVYVDKVESKIKGREGMKFYEKGTFMTLRQMQEQLESAIPSAAQEEMGGNDFARLDVVATYDRLQAVRQVEEAAIHKLEQQGVSVNSSVNEPVGFVSSVGGKQSPADRGAANSQSNTPPGP